VWNIAGGIYTNQPPILVNNAKCDKWSRCQLQLNQAVEPIELRPNAPRVGCSIPLPMLSRSGQARTAEIGRQSRGRFLVVSQIARFDICSNAWLAVDGYEGRCVLT
jgi:hypothetical protein